jgi:hypothetical protein
LFITRHIFVVTDPRPLYTWPESMLGVEPDVDEVGPVYTHAYMYLCIQCTDTYPVTYIDTETCMCGDSHEDEYDTLANRTNLHAFCPP